MTAWNYFEQLDPNSKNLANFLTSTLAETRPQEIVIIGMLAVAIGIGIAILVQLKKLKDRL